MISFKYLAFFLYLGRFAPPSKFIYRLLLIITEFKMLNASLSAFLSLFLSQETKNPFIYLLVSV